MMDELILGVTEAAEYLGISAVTAHRLIQNGEFPPPRESKGQAKVVRIWFKKDLDNFKKALRRPGQRKAESEVENLRFCVLELEKQVASLKEENRELKEEIIRLRERNLTEKAEKEKNTPDEKKEDWQAIRKLLLNAVKKQGGKRPLARQLGISESIIRRFLKGECKRLSVENVAKIKQMAKPE